MNKSTKIWLNYLFGGIISAVLLWAICIQVIKQADTLGKGALWQTGQPVFLWLCILLMPVNLLLEGRKWHILAGSAQRLSYGRAFASYLAGIAFSIVTPNRIGEYPGRILYLKRKNTFRLISVSALGGMAQMFSLFIFGLAGLLYYNPFPGNIGTLVLIASVIATIFVGVVYWRFETWLPLLQKVRWLRKYNIYGQLLMRFTTRQQFNVLLISLLRYAVFTAQYLFLLRWMRVDMPLAEGFCLSALFFWVIAIIPSIALAEIGERSWASWFVFHHVSSNTIGIVSATMGIWFLNLIIPAIVGSILLFRMRLVR